MRLMHKVWAWLLAPYPGYAADGRTLPWRVFDRAIRPFSFAVSLATFVLTLGIATDNTVGVSLDSGLGVVVIVAASSTTTALLWWGWWAKSTSLMTHGLLLAAAVWAAAGYVILLEGASWVSGCVALCWGVGAAGSWLLEVNDPNVKGG